MVYYAYAYEHVCVCTIYGYVHTYPPHYKHCIANVYHILVKAVM